MVKLTTKADKSFDRQIMLKIERELGSSDVLIISLTFPSHLFPFFALFIKMKKPSRIFGDDGDCGPSI